MVGQFNTRSSSASLMTKVKSDLLTLDEATIWASQYLNKQVSKSNISYLIQYAKIKLHKSENISKISVKELKEYYDTTVLQKPSDWKSKMGNNIDWELAFDNLSESDTTKHVHRLHPYKGKFIPQLVEYFLDEHLNTLKKEIYFNKNDIVLDPFMGSGTTLVQSSELGLHSIGIDVSEFNSKIAETKIQRYNIPLVEKKMMAALKQTQAYVEANFDLKYDEEVSEILSNYNKEFFPNIEYKVKLQNNEIDEEQYANQTIQKLLTNKPSIKTGYKLSAQMNLFADEASFVSKWYSPRIIAELNFYKKQIEKEPDKNIRNLMMVVLSRTARSCRSTTHSDLATLKKPQVGPYYCHKHRKICNPINTIKKQLKRYTFDTIKRIQQFDKLRKETKSFILTGDSRDLDIFLEIEKMDSNFGKMLRKRKIDGVFTSPPYLGQIDYHEQHAYAYELFKIKRADEKEIGPQFKGTSKLAKEEYVDGIAKVLSNVGKFIKDNGNFFIVANDKLNLYPEIANRSGLKIVEKFIRPVLNRTERDRQPYSETIFRMQKL